MKKVLKRIDAVVVIASSALNRRMKKRDYYQLMNRELVKRGCQAIFSKT